MGKDEKRSVKNSGITIRRMAISDAPAAAVLEQKCFSMPWPEKSYQDTLANENAVYLAAENAVGELIGTCGVLNILGEGNINNVAVAESYRRRGIAKRMLSELLRQGKERGITEFFLEVRASNEAAVRLYEKLGFIEVGRRKGFYERPKEDALIYKKYADDFERKRFI